MILYFADLFRWLMRTSVRSSRNLSSFNFYRSSALQSKGHDDAARLGGMAFELV
jgi:hypothetical protein